VDPAADDPTLLAAVAAGEAEAMAALFDRHAATLLALCVRILRDRAAAEEVVSDVFFELWRRPERYDAARGSGVGYLIRLTRSRAIDRLRAGRSDRLHLASTTDDRSGETSSDPLDPTEPHAAMLQGQIETHVRGALAGLSPGQRHALELAYFGGLSHSEVAETLGEPLGTVKSRIRQGLARLREALLPIYESGALS